MVMGRSSLCAGSGKGRNARVTFGLVVVAVVGAGLAATPALADVLPAATGSASAGAACVAFTGAIPPSAVSIVPPDSMPIALTAATNDGCAPTHDGSASGGVVVSGGTDPTIIVQGASSGQDGMGGDGAGQLSFYFEVTGPGSGEVPLTMYGNSSLAQSLDGSNYYVQEDIQVSVSYWSGTNYPANDYPFSTYSGGSLNSTFNVGLGDIYQVYMSADADAFSWDGGTAFAQAKIDPTFSLGSGCTGCSIAFSPGINALHTASSGTAVPEPATWTMLFAGFLLIGLASLRQRRDGMCSRG